MRALSPFLLVCLVSAVAPCFYTDSPASGEVTAFPGWPVQLEEKLLTQVALTPQEVRFQKSFPGRIAKFTDGRRIIVLRWLTQVSRKLHPAADCFKGLGYTVSPLPVWRDSHGRLWGCSEANSSGDSVKIRERVFDESGQSWPDISSWYWSASLGKSAGPWWAVTVVEKLEPQ